MKSETITITTEASCGRYKLEFTAEVVNEDWSNLKTVRVVGDLDGVSVFEILTGFDRIQDDADLEELARNTLLNKLESLIRTRQDVDYPEYA